MEKLAYAMFVMLDGFAIGAAMFGVWAETMLYRLADDSRERRAHAYALSAKVGFAVTSAILLFAVIQGGTVQSNWRTWFYLAGLAVAGVGFAGLTRVSTDALAEKEAKNRNEVE